ncbi:MAG: S1C family serine protease [Anaerolineae bacterium]
MKGNFRLVGLLALVAVALLGCSLVSMPGAEQAIPTPQVIIKEVTSTLQPQSLLVEPDAEEQLLINIYKRVSPAVVYIEVNTGFGTAAGSGFVIDREGHIVTNNHVVESARELLVEFADQSTATAKVVGTDPYTDLAVIKVVDVPTDKLVPVELGDSSTLQVGQRAIAIGNPFGRQFERTMTVGIISALGRSLPSDPSLPSGYQNPEIIQTDAAINPGNSGGPLLDSHGLVIGVNTAIRSTSGTSSGVGFAVPVDTLKRVVPELIKTGSYKHPCVGVLGMTVTAMVADELGLTVDHGAYVDRVAPGGPADRAGLLEGDVILAIDGTELKSFNDFIVYLARNTEAHQTVKLTLLRNGKEMELDLKLGERRGASGCR